MSEEEKVTNGPVAAVEVLNKDEAVEKIKVVTEGYDPILTLLKSGKNFASVLAAIIVSVVVTKLTALKVELTPELQAYLTTGLTAVFSALWVAFDNWRKNKDLKGAITPLIDFDSLSIGDIVQIPHKVQIGGSITEKGVDNCVVDSFEKNGDVVLRILPHEKDSESVE